MDDSRMNHLLRIHNGKESLDVLNPPATKEDYDFLEELKRSDEMAKGTIFEDMASYVPYD